VRADAGTTVPSRTAGLTRLGALADVVGRYGTARNCADGLTTSRLSPYLRRRLVLEEEVLGFARTVGSFELGRQREECQVVTEVGVAKEGRPPKGFFPFWEAARVPLQALHRSP